MGKIDQMDRGEVMAEIRRIQQEFPALAEATKGAIDVESVEIHPSSKDAKD